MQSRIAPLLSSLALAATLTAVALPASAATSRVRTLSAASVCNTALPVGQSQISVRSYGIYNAGPDANYVSCNLPIDVTSDIKSDSSAVPATIGAYLWLGFKNFSLSLSRKATCNVSGGSRSDGIAAGSSKTTTILGNSEGWLSWTNIDRYNSWGSLNVSCILPPGVELGEINVTEYDASNGL